MVIACCVPVCPFVQNDIRSEHRFPRDKQTRKKWIEVCSLDEITLPKAPRVCGEHFMDSDLVPEIPGYETGIRRLKQEAVPSLFLNIDPHDPLEDDIMQDVQVLQSPQQVVKTAQQAVQIAQELKDLLSSGAIKSNNSIISKKIDQLLTQDQGLLDTIHEMDNNSWAKLNPRQIPRVKDSSGQLAATVTLPDERILSPPITLGKRTSTSAGLLLSPPAQKIYAADPFACNFLSLGKGDTRPTVSHHMNAIPDALEDKDSVGNKKNACSKKPKTKTLILMRAKPRTVDASEQTSIEPPKMCVKSTNCRIIGQWHLTASKWEKAYNKEKEITDGLRRENDQIRRKLSWLSKRVFLQPQNNTEKDTDDETDSDEIYEDDESSYDSQLIECT